jgi:hypothetical protein
MSFSLRWLALLLGAVSIFSLAQKLYDFATAPIIGDLLPYFRASIHSMAGAASGALEQASRAVNFASPLFSAELVMIYFALGFVLLVLYVGDDIEWRRSGGEPITVTSLAGRFAIAFLWPVMLPAALYFVFEATPNTLGTWIWAIGKMLASAVFLFALNACFSTLL